jgi:biotin synthase
LFFGFFLNRIGLRFFVFVGFTGKVTDSFFPEIRTLHSRGSEQQALHEQARAAADAEFGKTVFLRGVVEVSNFCRENCHYCGMRRDNKSLHRYRARYEQLAEMLIHHRPPSITDVNIQTGEDPVAVREVVLPLIKALRAQTPLGISVCLGTLNPATYAELQAAGASIYIMKFEIADAQRYAAMEAPGTQAERLETIRHLASTGWSVSSGFIAGLPNETPEQQLMNFKLAAELPLSGCSVSPFIPGDETPLESCGAADIDLTLNCMAALRLMRRDWVIPAVSALNIAQPGSGYGRGLRTGANLVTINLTPDGMRQDYLLYKRNRFIMTEEKILNAISSEGLTPSRQGLAEFYRARKAKAARAA